MPSSRVARAHPTAAEEIGAIGTIDLHAVPMGAAQARHREETNGDLAAKVEVARRRKIADAVPNGWSRWPLPLS